jgi:acyl phosphate:glycerol-3-phosphate acyltransferase
MNPAWLALAIAYLLGSIPFGYVIVKLREGRDIRRAGSGNIGAANVTRTLGVAAGLLTLLLDAAKGSLAVAIASRLAHGNMRWLMAAGLLAIAGHLFPVWLGFRGGRGVATAAGVFLLLSWKAVLAAAVVWLVAVLWWRYVSLGSVLAAASLPLLVYVLYVPGHRPPLVVSLGTACASILVIVRHRANLERLAAGTEPRVKLRR